MMLNKLRIALAVTVLALTAVSAAPASACEWVTVYGGGPAESILFDCF